MMLIQLKTMGTLELFNNDKITERTASRLSDVSSVNDSVDIMWRPIFRYITFEVVDDSRQAVNYSEIERSNRHSHGHVFGLLLELFY